MTLWHWRTDNKKDWTLTSSLFWHFFIHLGRVYLNIGTIKWEHGAETIDSFSLPYVYIWTYPNFYVIRWDGKKTGRTNLFTICTLREWIGECKLSREINIDKMCLKDSFVWIFSILTLVFLAFKIFIQRLVFFCEKCIVLQQDS